MTEYVSYLRVSTREQRDSGLGLEAQQEAIRRYLETVAGPGSKVIQEYREIESGRNPDRPQLAAAIAQARRRRAVLLIAKLDRLGRSVAKVASMLESGIVFRVADDPNASILTLQLKAMIAEEEARAISERTSRALQSLKRRGKNLGFSDPVRLERGDHLKANAASVEITRGRADEFAMRMLPILRGYQGSTLMEIAEELNASGVKTSRGGSWYPTTVRNLMHRIERLQASQQAY